MKKDHMMQSYGRAGTYAICVALLCCGLSSLQAGAAQPGEEPVVEVALSDAVADGLVSPDAVSYSGLSDSDYAAVTFLRERDTDGQIVAEELVSGNVLNVYVSGDVSRFERLLSSLDTDCEFSIVEAPYSLQELETEMDRLVEDTDSFGGALVSMNPKTDGTGIEVVLDEEKTGDVGVPYSDDSEAIPVDYSLGRSAEAASRANDAAPFSVGTSMSRFVSSNSRSTVACSTGFWGTGKFSDRQLVTANHCGVGSQYEWHSGERPSGTVIGSGSAAFGTELDAAGIAVESSLSIQPVVYWGSDTTTSGVVISGVVSTPVVGTYVCYSGAPSGTVCSNKVDAVEMFVQYSGQPLYKHMVRTTQTGGIPAVGNGDSGGPVVAVSSEGYVYAAGIISGIHNGSDSCTGKPATETRKCSAVAYFAPVYDYLVATGTSLYVYRSSSSS